MKGRIASSTIRTSAVLGLRLIVQAGSLLLVARLLGPQQFGVFVGVTALAVLFGTLSTFGMHLVLLGEISKDPARRTQVLPYAVPTTLVCGCVLLAFFLWVCSFTLPGNNISWHVLLAIGLAELLVQPLSSLVVTELLALERTARSQLLQTLPLFLRFVAAGAVFLWQPNNALILYGYGYCIATVIALAVTLRCLPQRWPHFQKWRMPTREDLRESVSFAVLNITAMGPAELDKALAVRLLPPTAAGLYAAGARIMGAVTLPVIALMLSAIPRLFREGQNQPQRTAHLIFCIFAVTIAYSMALAIALWWCAPVFIWLLGDGYEGLDETIRWLCIAVPGMALRIAAGSALMALGKPWMRAIFELIGLVVLIFSAGLLAIRADVYGMPLALACAEWVMAFFGGFLLVRLIKKNSA